MGPWADQEQGRAPSDKFEANVRDTKLESWSPLPKSRSLVLVPGSCSLALVPSSGHDRASGVGICGAVGSIPKGFISADLWAAHKVLGILLSLDREVDFSLHIFVSVNFCLGVQSPQSSRVASCIPNNQGMSRDAFAIRQTSCWNHSGRFFPLRLDRACLVL